MNGWEFLETYNSFKEARASNVVILHNKKLLKEEETKLKEYPFVKAITNKNLHKEFLVKLNKELTFEREKIRLRLSS